MDFKKERELEEKYLPVLAYVEAGKLLADSEITAGKLRGALTSFCRKEKYERPSLFTEMENEFVPDFLDWWWETVPEFHKLLNENKTRIAASEYLAYVNVWKAKFKNHEILTDACIIQASTMLTVKNSLSASVTAWLSYNKRINRISQADITKVFPEMFQSLLPIIHGIQSGIITQPKGTRIEDAARLLGSFYAGHPATIGLSQSLKQIEYVNQTVDQTETIHEQELVH